MAGFFRGVGTIPVDRRGGKASEAALRTGLRGLSEGGLFGIYPEGTRSPDGRLYRGKTGIARLALESGPRSSRSRWSTRTSPSRPAGASPRSCGSAR